MANQGRQDHDRKDGRRVAEMKGIYEQKLDELKKIAMNYVESLLANENDIDVVVLRYMLNDLLPPLQNLKLNTEALILQAIKERHLPFILNGTMYSRQGPRLKISRSSNDSKERSMLQAFVRIVTRSLEDARSITTDELVTTLEAESFVIPDNETIESLLERSIKLGFFKGYVDLVDGGRIYRQKTENEAYQEQFLKELNALSKESTLDFADGKAIDQKIPGDLEALLLSPEQPRNIESILEKSEEVSTNIEDFIMDACQVGKRVSISDLSKQLKTRVHDEQLDVPFQIDQDTVERMLEKMVEDRKLSGYFEDDVHFLRKR
ncbi:MAG TPA: hypothetical protein VKM55_16735 [Candidatus Lokiarchaeia archaeon]|nr:hypothetical protein [Candidatus Lokiarchaeia archaeon]